MNSKTGQWSGFDHEAPALRIRNGEASAGVQVEMAENEGAREAVLSRLRSRLDRMGDLVGAPPAVERSDDRDAARVSAHTGPASGLEAVFRAQGRSVARSIPDRPGETLPLSVALIRERRCQASAPVLADADDAVGDPDWLPPRERWLASLQMTGVGGNRIGSPRCCQQFRIWVRSASLKLPARRRRDGRIATPASANVVGVG